MKSEKRVLLLLAASAAVIILVTVLTLFSGKEEPTGTKNPVVRPTGTVPTGVIRGEYNKLMMVKAVDTEAGTITLYDLEDGGEAVLTYGVAADIRTKYGSLTYAASLKHGELVRAEYDAQSALVRMKKSDEHWELHGVDEFSVTETMLSVNGVNYKLTERTVAYAEGARIALGEVKSMDRVNLWGVGSELVGIEVTKGHGSVKLINCDAFAGAEVTIGDAKYTLEEGASYLVREGSYNIFVKGDKNAVAVEVQVKRNEQKVIDLYEYGGAPAQTAQMRFKINPFSAELRIDGELTEYYEQDLTVSYGEHEIEVSLGGYKTYKGTLVVNRPYQTIQINLSENPATVPDDGSGDTDNPETGNDGDTEEQPENPGQTGEGDKEDPEGNNPEGNDPGSDGGEDDPIEPDDGGDTDVSERRYVPIGAAGGYEYDPDRSTFILVPEGAVVLIDGISLGAAPVEFEKLLGTYTVTLRKDGKEKEYTVTVGDDGEDVYWKFPMN